MSEKHAEGSIPRMPLMLGVAAVLPFWAAALASLDLWPWSGSSQARAIATVYGAIMLAFFGGVRWGAASGPYDRQRIGRETTLAMIPPMAGFAALLLPPILGLALLVSGFLIQALWDVTSAQNGRLAVWIARLRTVMTGIAVSGLLVILVKLLLTRSG